jgi:hypothetical protein
LDNPKYVLAARYVPMANLRMLAEARTQAGQEQQAQEPEVYGQKPEGW